MSASSSGRQAPEGRGRSRGRGRGRGRPSKESILRREALDEARADAGISTPSLMEHTPSTASAIEVHGAAVPPPRHQPELPSVSKDMVMSLREPLPALPKHPLGEIVESYAAAALTKQEELATQPATEFAREFWSPSSNVWHSTSNVAQASSKGMGGEQIKRSERRLSAAAELAERQTQVAVQTAIATGGPGVELLAFIEGARYDEATSLLAVEQPTLDYLLAAGIGQGEVSQALVQVLEHNKPKESTPTKVFQTESQWTALVAVPSGAGDNTKRYIVVTSDSVTCPQVLQQNTSECVAQALQVGSTIRPQAVSKFQWKMRLVCSDRAATNLAAERLLLRHCRPEWHKLFFPCEIHMSTAAQGKGLRLLDNIVTKLIRTALSLRLGGWMRVFRKCMLQEIIGTLEVLEGAPSPQVLLHRRKVMCMCMKAGAVSRKNRAILACLPNGDWTLSDRIQIFVKPGQEWNRVAISLLVAKALQTALIGSNFKVFNRNRWTNNDVAVNQLGLLESCHRLLSRTYRRWLVAVGYDGPLKEMLAPAAMAPPVPAMAHMVLGEGVAEDGGLPEAPVAEGDGTDGEGEGGAAGEDVAADPEEPHEVALPVEQEKAATDFAAQNLQNRAVGAEWILTGCPLMDLVLSRVTMEPSMAILRRQLRMGSHKWEEEQDGKLLGESMGEPREYRLLVCARGELDTLFARHQMQVLWTPSLFSVLPAGMRTEQLSCLAFRMTTRVGAEHERVLASRHRRPPFTLFMATQSRQVTQQVKEMQEKTPCLLDQFSREFLASHDIENPDSLAILRVIMAMSKVDTALIECWHAWTRRVVTRLGTQASRPTQHDVFARHVAQRIKRRTSQHDRWQNPAGTPLTTGETEDAAAEDTEGAVAISAKAEAKKRAGGGGAYRAHVSKKLRAGENDWKDIGASFRARTPMEVAADRTDGKDATKRRKAGLPAFGLTRRQEATARIENAARVFNRLHGSADTSFFSISDTPIEPTLAECNEENYTYLMKVVRKADFLLATERRQMEKSLVEAAHRFASSTGRAMLDQVARDVPAIAEVQDKLFAMPTDSRVLNCERMCVAPRSDDMSIRAMSVDSEEGHQRSSTRNLGVGLDAYWSARMRPIAPYDWTGPAVVPDPETRCFKAGCCLCDAAGRQLYKFRNLFMANHKLLTMKDTAERDLMNEGWLVWRLRGVPLEPLCAGLAVADDDSSGDIDEDTNMFWHMPLVHLKPYVPVFHVLNCDAVDQGEKIDPHAELAVQASNR